MQANDEVARRLAQLTVRAGEQRAQIHSEIEMMRSRPATAAQSVGKDALKAAKALGLTDPKVAIPLARTVFIPATLAIARLVLKNGSPRRYLGAALIAASSFGIFKGMEYDAEQHAKKSDQLTTPNKD